MTVAPHTRTSVTIGKCIKVHSTPWNHPFMEHTVTVKAHGREYSASCFFRIVNGKAVYSVDQCDEDTFAIINTALIRKGERAVAQILQGGK